MRTAVAIAIAALVSLAAHPARAQAPGAPPAAAAPPVSAVSIVAEVNGQPVTRKDWDEELALDGTWREIQQQGSRVSDAVRSQVRARVLDQYIDQVLIEQEAKERKVELTTDDEREVDKQFDAVVKERWGDRKNLELDLADRGVPLARLRAKFRLHFLIQRLLEADYFKSDSFVRPAEVREYYQQHLDEFRVSGETVFDHIDFRLADYGPDDALAAARAALAEIRAGKPFAEVARATKYDYVHRDKGGEWRVPTIDSLTKSTAAALHGLKPGEVAGPIEESSCVRIVRLVSQRAESHKSFEEVEDEIQRTLDDTRRTTRLDDLRKRLRAEATIKRWQG